MDSVTIFIIGVFVLIGLMFARVWIGLAMGLVGFVGFALISGWPHALNMLAREPYIHTSFYPIVAMPLFMFMGAVVSITGISADLYDTTRKWIGQARGGLAMATTLACGGFAAMSGDSISTAVAMGKITYPEMKKYGYDDRLSAGCIAAGGTIGVLIPPSVMFILYGIFTETSIGELFIAGIIPGITEALFYVATIYVVCRLNPQFGPPGPRTTLKEKLASLPKITPMVIIFLSVIVGIYGGFVTPTEAGALGAAGAIIVGLAMRRLRWQPFYSALRETAGAVSMVLFLLIGAFIFMRFTTISGIPAMLGDYVAGMVLPNWLILAAVITVYIILGCFLNSIASMILTLPIMLPVIVEMGYSVVWWGVIMVRVIEVAMITPPVGINVFVISKALNLPLSTVYRGIGPFVVADILHIALLLAVPELSLWLVYLMRG